MTLPWANTDSQQAHSTVFPEPLRESAVPKLLLEHISLFSPLSVKAPNLALTLSLPSLSLPHVLGQFGV